MFCTNCGKTIPDDSSFCGYCGEHLDRDIENDNKEIEYGKTVENIDKSPLKTSAEKDNNDLSGKEHETSTDNIENDDKSVINSTKQTNQELHEERSEDSKTIVDKHEKNEKRWSVLDKINANKEEKLQGKSKYDTAEIKYPPDIPVDLYKVNKSIQQSVIPAGVKVVNKYNKPLSTVSFFLTQIVLWLPIINIILLLIWAFRKKSNANRKAYARSILIWLLLIVIALVIGIITLLALGYPLNINYWLNEIQQTQNV